MSEDYPDDSSLGRLLNRIRKKRDDARAHILAGHLSQEEYRALCERHSTCAEILADAAEISRGEDLKPPDRMTSIMENIEGP